MTKKSIDSLSQCERIEYYLGKDRFHDRFWESTIPKQWEIPARGNSEYHFFSPNAKSATLDEPRTEIKYHLNDYGYRSHYDYGDLDIGTKKVIGCFGCSNVYGACVEYDKIWPSLLQEKLGDDYLVMNFGIPSLSNDGIARIGYRAMTALSSNLEAACVLWAPMSLREFVTKKFQSGVHILDNNHLPFDDWWDHIDWVGNNYNYGKNRALLSSTAVSLGAKFIDLMINIDDEKYQFDLIQFGPYNAIGEQTHAAIAEWYHKQLTGNLSLYQEISRP